jgi:hypothetical protein
LREQGVFGAFPYHFVGVFGEQGEQFGPLDLYEAGRPRADSKLALARCTARENLLI